MCLLTNDGDHHGELFLISCPNNSRRGIISTFSNIIGYKEVVKSFKVSLKRLRGWIMGVMPLLTLLWPASCDSFPVVVSGLEFLGE